jgi:hypothetical protein
LKSRAMAGPILIRAMARLPLEELRQLAAREGSGGDSDYSLLARAIMGPGSAKHATASREKDADS